MPTRFRSKRSSSSTQDDQVNRTLWMTSNGTTLTHHKMLEEYGKYESVQGKKVHLANAIDHQDMILYYGSEIFNIL